MHHIFSESQQITEPVRKYNNLDEVYKVQNQSETKLIKWDSSRSIKLIYFI